MTAIEIVDDDVFLGTENNMNMFTCQKDRLVSGCRLSQGLIILGLVEVVGSGESFRVNGAHSTAYDSLYNKLFNIFVATIRLHIDTISLT